MHSYKAGWRLVNQYSVCFHGCAVGAKALGRQPRCCLSMNSVIESGRVQRKRHVKSSQVKFKMANAIPPPLVPLAGASDREGRSPRNRLHWKAPRRGIIPIVLLLIIAGTTYKPVAPIAPLRPSRCMRL